MLVNKKNGKKETAGVGPTGRPQLCVAWGRYTLIMSGN